MLFNAGDNALESEKERNFYFKFFAGYFFNELVGSRTEYEQRVRRFQDLLRKPPWPSESPYKDLSLDPDHLTVSFDLHEYLFDPAQRAANVTGSDLGEFADIGLYSEPATAAPTMVAVEAKFFSRWKKEKDLFEVGERLWRISRALEQVKLVRCLLVREWGDADVARIQGQKYPGPRVVVLTWKDLLGAPGLSVADEWLQRQLDCGEKREFGYRWQENGLVRTRREKRKRKGTKDACAKAEVVLRTLPEHVRTEVHEIWEKVVRGGRARLKAKGDTSGREALRRISGLIRDNDVEKHTQEWTTIRDCGREYYYED